MVVQAPERSDDEQLLSDGIVMVPEQSHAEPHGARPPSSFDLGSVSAESVHRPTIRPANISTPLGDQQNSIVEIVPADTGNTARLVVIGAVLVALAAIVIYVLVSG